MTVRPNLQNTQVYILDKSMNLLPPEVLWRTKAQFSDSGHEIIDSLKHYSKSSESKLAMTNEHGRYIDIFKKYYPCETSISTVPVQESVACSTERASKWIDIADKDTSGRFIEKLN